MDDSSGFNDAYDPLDLASETASARGWINYFIESARDTLLVEVPGKYKQISLAITWSAVADLLLLRIYTPLTFTVPSYALGELYRLLNYCNSQSLVGSWYYEVNENLQPFIMWRQEIPTDQTSLTPEQMHHILSTCAVAHDTFFLALISFLSAKPTLYAAPDGTRSLTALGVTVEEAMTYIERTPLFGRA